MKKQVLGKTHDTDKLKTKKKPMGVVEIEKSAYEKPKPLPFRTDDEYEEEYLRPESPEVVDLRDRYPPRRDWGRIITDPPVCSDHKKKIQDDDSEEEYLRPVSPEVVDLRDRYPPRDWGWIVTDPPVCSDHKKKIVCEPDSHDFDWVLRVMELNETEDPDMEDDTPLSHAIEGKPEVKLTSEV